VPLAELSDRAPADGRLEVPGDEHVEGVSRVALSDRDRAAREGPGLAEEREPRELARREVLEDAPSLWDPVDPATGSCLGQLETRQQAAEAADSLLEGRLAIDEPPVVGLAQAETLATGCGDDIGDAHPSLVADAPFTEGIGLHQPGHEPPTILHRGLPIGDDEEVER